MARRVVSGLSAYDPIADLRFILSIGQMKRQRLVWFATGAAFSAIAAVVAAMTFQRPQQEQGWFLRVAEEGQSLRDGRSAAIWRGAEIARDCGAQSFEMLPGGGSDQMDATRIPLTRENNPTLGCIVERARDAELWIGVQLEPLTAS